MTALPVPTARESIAVELAAIAADGRLRKRSVIEGAATRTVRIATDGAKATLLNWAGNDYLGLTRDRRVLNGAARALRRCGSGAGAARLLAGGLRLHRHVEQSLAKWLGRADALLTPSGYQANLAALTALASDNEDVVILDRLCHASLYDGAALCAGTMLRFTHNDVADLERQLQRSDSARRRIVCVESIYSMDGDAAPLRDIAACCARHGALLLVDEAHALGVCGPGGKGRCAELGVTPDVWVATCSKTLAAQGGLIVADQDVIDLIVNRGRSAIFTTALTPAAAGAALAAWSRLRDEPSMPQRLAAMSARVRDALRAQGWPVAEGISAIIPVVVGDEAAALAMAAALRAHGHFAPAIRPPTVPAGTCRIRLTITLHHRPRDLRRLIEAFAQLAAERTLTANTQGSAQ